MALPDPQTILNKITTLNEIAESTRLLTGIANSMRETAMMTRKTIVESRDLIDQIARQLQK